MADTNDPNDPQAPNAPRGLKMHRRWTDPDKHPYDEIEWVKRSAVITGANGEIVFEQKDVEVPASWSQLATNVVASKYFRGALGSPERETSVCQLIGRVAVTITNWAMEGKYFDTEDDLYAFRDELTYLLLNQHAAFNSPVWFNVGIEDKPQCSACFINSVDDTMESIFELCKTEGLLFKYGSGTGTNLSPLRGSQEALRGGGHASGPVSFMRGYDAFAGVIKSGGKLRRAAKMVILDVDHPDIEDFINCKVREEKKAQALIDAGYDGSVGGEAYDSVFFQNSNNSVRVTDDFMRAVENDKTFSTRNRRDGKEAKIYNACGLLRQIAEATHACGDPGLQFHDTINDWHTCPESGQINASNPCCMVYDTLVETSEGRIEIGKLAEMVELPHALSFDFTTGLPVAKRIKKAWKAGKTKNLVKVTTDKGLSFTSTPDHRYYLKDGSTVEAQDLKPGMRLQELGLVSYDKVASVEFLNPENPVPVYDIEVEGTHNFGVMVPGKEHAIVISNSEYMFLDDSACNLASLNLMKFRDAEGEFDVEGFKHAVDIMITAQDILVDNASYPTEKIEKNSHAFRPLGLGYANLGALLMARGLPYDSNEGRQYAAAVTSLMCGEAYAQSARIAKVKGPFEAHDVNAKAILKVIGKHAEENKRCVKSSLKVRLAATDAWTDARSIGGQYGFRNAQVTVLAPTGTIGFMMDCDTTGIEPALSLITYKQLQGGGRMVIYNRAVEKTLEHWGYEKEDREEILAHLEKHGTIEGAPHMSEKDLPVFDCALKPAKGKRFIQPMGHVRMMAAVQPFLSGAISKTVNVPNETTVEEIENIYMEAWERGLKAIAIYRDGCKRAQPLTTSKDQKTTTQPTAKTEEEMTQLTPYRKRLPRDRHALTHKFSIAGHEGYVTVGMYEDGTPGEVFITMSKEGSTISGLMDSLATSISLALQYGVPLHVLVDKFSHTRYEPSGFTGNSEIPIAKSITDYLFRWLDSRFSKRAQEAGDGELVPEEKSQPQAEVEAYVNQADAPGCASCGSIMVRSGACYKCTNCGSTSGCS